MAIWGSNVSTIENQALSAPKWYARNTLINLDEAKTDRGISFEKASTSYQKGDTLFFYKLSDGQPIQCIGQAIVVDVVGSVCQLDVDIEGEGAVLVVNYNTDTDVANIDFNKETPFLLIPITIEQLEADAENPDHPLRHLGFVSPGWYRFKQTPMNADRGECMIYIDLVVSMRMIGQEDVNASAPTVIDAFTIMRDHAGNPIFDENGQPQAAISLDVPNIN